jgi:hypothetical protein
MIWIMLCGIISVSGSLFYCTQISKTWNVEGPGNCVNHKTLYFAILGFNILNGLALPVIPKLFLRNLQIVEKQRVVLLSIFPCGFL